MNKSKDSNPSAILEDLIAGLTNKSKWVPLTDTVGKTISTVEYVTGEHTTIIIRFTDDTYAYLLSQPSEAYDSCITEPKVQDQDVRLMVNVGLLTERECKFQEWLNKVRRICNDDVETVDNMRQLVEQLKPNAPNS